MNWRQLSSFGLVRQGHQPGISMKTRWEQEIERGNQAFVDGCYSGALNHYLRARAICYRAINPEAPCPDWLAAYGATTANIAHCWAVIGLPDQATEALALSMKWLRSIDTRFEGQLPKTLIRKLFQHWHQLQQCRLRSRKAVKH